MTYTQLKKDTIDLIEKSGKLTRQLNFNATAEKIEQYKSDLIKKEMTIVTVGEMKRGKSSMLNALLNEQDLFPVDINVATNAVTILRYGEQEEIVVHCQVYDVETQEFQSVEKQISRDEIELYVTEKHNAGNYKGVVALNAKVKNDFLKDGVVFVDTPGLGSMNIAHAEVTYSFLNNADLIIFVSDISKSLTESELKFLARAYKNCPNILFALTKKDLSVDFDDIIQDNTQKIKQTIDIKEDEIKITPISSLLKMKYLQTQEQRQYTASGYKKFEDLIWTTIARKKAVTTILPFLLATKEEIDDLAENIIMQYQVLEEDEEKIQELIAELEKQKAEYEDFVKESTNWKNDVTNFSNDLYKNILKNIDNARQEAVEYLDIAVAEAGNSFLEKNVYDQITQNINIIISNTVLSMKETIENDVNDKTEQLYQSLRLNVSVSRNLFEKIDYTPKDHVEVKFPKKSFKDKAVARGRTVGMTSIATTGIGAAVGIVALSTLAVFTGGVALAGIPAIIANSALVGAQWGGAIGTVVGGGKAAYETVVDKKLPSDIPNIVRTINRHITNSLKDASELLREAASDIGKEIISNINQELIARKDSVSDNIKQMNDNVAAKRTDLPKRRQEIKVKLENIQLCQKALSAKEQAINEFSDAPNTTKPSFVEKTQSTSESTKEEKPKVVYGFM